jgi:hypothetical protein
MIVSRRTYLLATLLGMAATGAVAAVTDTALPWWLSMAGLFGLLAWLRPAGGYRCWPLSR